MTLYRNRFNGMLQKKLKYITTIGNVMSLLGMKVAPFSRSNELSHEPYDYLYWYS